VQNAPDIAGYSRAIEAGQLATVKGLAISADDGLRAGVIERLMCDLSVDLDAFAERGYFADELASLIAFERDGLVAIEGHRIKITERGRPFVRVVASVFDVYLRDKPRRHSSAV
jgi:oxygen-independent coproporphyrinogen-3 oxidase